MTGFNALVPRTRKNTGTEKGHPIEKADAWYKTDLFGDWLEKRPLAGPYEFRWSSHRRG